MIYDNILQTIGNTPVVRLHRVKPDHVDLYVKVEGFNPMASVKDRLAFASSTMRTAAASSSRDRPSSRPPRATRV